MPYLKTFLIPLFLITLLLCSCSNDDEKQTETGTIDTMTTKAAQEAAEMIKTPMDKAQAAADLETERIRDMEKRDNQ